jgi:hypothetical protein
MASLTFYPSLDGKLYHHLNQSTWAYLVAAAGTNASYTDSQTGLMLIYSESTQDRWSELYRAVFLFDTSSIPSNAVITGATFSIYGTTKYDTLGSTPEINIYSSDPASNTELVAGDYDSLGSTAFCDTPITYAGYSTSGYNDFVLNSTGLAAISTTGITKLGIRNSNYDVAETSPTWVASKLSGFYCYYSEQGTGYQPKLVVTYNYANTLTTSMGMSPTLIRATTHSRSLTTAIGFTPVIRGLKDLGDWLCIGSKDSGSIKTKDGVTWSTCSKYTDGGAAIPAAWLAQFENRLCTLNIDDTGFSYSAVNALNGEWTDKANLPNLSQDFKGMFVGRDASDNPTLYFLTTKGMYYLDVFTNFVFGPTEAAWEEDDTAGKKGLYWKGDNYVAVGKGILKISGGVATPIGPDMDDGLPEDLQGTITDMLGVGFWLVIAVDGGASKKSCILKRYITGDHWHPVYVGSTNTPIATIFWDSGTLYFGEGTNVRSLPLTNVMSNAKYLSGDRIASGDIIYPRFYSEFEAMPKIAHKVRAVTRDCTADEKVTIYYRIDEATDWTTLGSFITSPRPTALSFPASGDSVGVTFESIQLKAHYERGDTTTNSPKIESLTLEYRVTPPVLWGFDFNVLAVTRDDVDGQTIINALRTAMSTGTLVSFYPTGDKNDTEYFVEFTAMPSAEKGTEFGQEGIFRVSVQEVID